MKCTHEEFLLKGTIVVECFMREAHKCVECISHDDFKYSHKVEFFLI